MGDAEAAKGATEDEDRLGHDGRPRWYFGKEQRGRKTEKEESEDELAGEARRGSMYVRGEGRKGREVKGRSYQYIWVGTEVGMYILPK